MDTPYYEWATYKHCRSAQEKLTKYCWDAAYGDVDNKKVLDAEDDVARAQWGGTWRIPTRAELRELNKVCSWKKETRNGVKGYVVTGPNKNSIFMPLSGRYSLNEVTEKDSYGFYWSSTLGDKYVFAAFYLSLSDDGKHGVGSSNRCDGLSVRAVTE